MHVTLGPATTTGERLIAAMKIDEMIAANKWFPCGYTWRSAKGHTSRFDYVLYDASRAEEIKKNSGIAHTVDLACGAAPAMCIEVKDETGTENNQRKKKKINIDDLRCKIGVCVLSCKEDFGHLLRSLETVCPMTPRNSQSFC